MKGGARVGAGRKKKKELTLEEEYADDPVLLKFYKKKLRIRGWAGTKSRSEIEWLKSHSGGG